MRWYQIEVGFGTKPRHTPAAQILIELRWLPVKHVTHARDTADVPRTDILVERVGTT